MHHLPFSNHDVKIRISIRDQYSRDTPFVLFALHIGFTAFVIITLNMPVTFCLHGLERTIHHVMFSPITQDIIVLFRFSKEKKNKKA